MRSALDELPRPFFALAPLDDVTDTVFRQIVADCAPPDLFFTEFVNVDGLQSPGRAKLLHKLRFSKKEKPLVAQVWGKTPESFYKTAQQLADGTLIDEIEWLRAKNGDAVQGANEARNKAYTRYGEVSTGESDTEMRAKHGGVASSAGQQTNAILSYAGVDINFGCPEKSVIRNGCCIAMVNNRQLADEIIQAVQEGAAGKLPVSVKTRLGLSDIDLTWHEFLLKYKLNMLTIHGRTAKEMSKVSPHWDKIEEICKLRDKLSPETLMVGNGDVMSRADGEELAKKHGLDGIMIGRGVFHDPFVFSGKDVWKTHSKQQKIALYLKHVELFTKTWANNERRVHTLNKFCKIYINDFDGAKELREKLMIAKSSDELLSLLTQKYYLP